MPLKAFRFKYDQTLEACDDGTYVIRVNDPAGPFETGRYVRKIQQALLDEGLTLPVHGVDGVYGPETATAVSQFKTDQNIQPNDGAVGQQTMQALDAIFADEMPFAPPVLGQGEMTLDDLLEAIQDAEGANSADTPEQLITRVRQLYYPGSDPNGLTIREVAFDQLLPDSPSKLPDGTRRILTPTGMNGAFFARLSMHAPENPTPANPQDNPSPYFYDTTSTRIDLGHLLLTIDAMLHPRADAPYSTFGVPAIDPASWVADLGIAAVWAEQNGVPDAPIVLAMKADGSADIDGYYQMSAPDADLYGDIDGINVAQIMNAGESLSSALVRYYVDGDTKPGLYRERFRLFLDTIAGDTHPDPAAMGAATATFTPRVDRFDDLFAAGAISALLTINPPPTKHWMFTDTVIAKFFQFLTDQLAIETGRFD